MKTRSGLTPNRSGAAPPLSLTDEEIALLHRRAQSGDLTLMLAHELNNLMTPLVARAEFALKRGNTEDQAKALERVLTQARRANDLAQRLIDYSQGRGVAFERRPLQELWDEAVATLPRPLEKDGSSVSTRIEEGLTVRTSGDLLIQVFFNLLLNARAALCEKPGLVSFSAQSANGEAVIRFADTGSGISPAQIDEVLNPFFAANHDPVFEANGASGSIGIGLRICRYIIGLHGGSIRMQPNAGTGLIVEMRLPLD